MADVNTSVALDLNIDTNAPEQIAAVTEQVKTGTEAFKEYKGEVRGLTGDVLTATKGTAEYNAQLTKLAEHRNEMTDLRQDIRALNPREATLGMVRFGETGVRALTGIAGAATLAAGGNEKMVKVMMEGFAVTQVMESALALAELKKQAMIEKNIILQKLGVAGYVKEGQAIRGATAAQALLNIVTEAWPIALIIAGVIAIVAAVKSWNSSIQDSIDLQQQKIDKLEEEKTELQANEKLSEKLATNAENRAKAEGKSIREIRDERDRALLSRIKDAEKEIDLDYKEMDRLSDKNALLLEQTHIWADIKHTIGVMSEAEYVKAITDNEAIEANNKLLKEKRNVIATLRADEDAMIIQQVQNKKDDADADKKAADDAKKASDAKIAAAKKTADEIAKEKEQAWKEQHKTDLENAKMTANLAKTVADEEKLELRQKYKQEREDKKAADAQKIADEKETQQAIHETAQSFADAAVSMGDLLLAKGKQQTDATKVLALIQLGIKEAVAIANIVESSTANPLNSTTFGAAGIAQMVAGIAGVVATIAEAKSILDGGGSSSAPSVSTSTGYSVPSISNSTAFGGAPQLTSNNGNTDYGYNTMSKTYVSQTDLNAAQATAYYQNLQRRKH